MRHKQFLPFEHGETDRRPCQACSQTGPLPIKYTRFSAGDWPRVPGAPASSRGLLDLMSRGLDRYFRAVPVFVCPAATVSEVLIREAAHGGLDGRLDRRGGIASRDIV